MPERCTCKAHRVFTSPRAYHHEPSCPVAQECSFTCPLTCAGPGDVDHESQADRDQRLSLNGGQS